MKYFFYMIYFRTCLTFTLLMIYILMPLVWTIVGFLEMKEDNTMQNIHDKFRKSWKTLR